MPIQYSWDDPERTIVCYEFAGKWTWDEAYEAFRLSWDEIKNLPHVVDSIADVSKVVNIPPSAMTHIRSFTQNRPENTGTMVIVGANSYLTLMFQTFSKVFQSTLRREPDIQATKTLDEARVLLARINQERDQADQS